MAVFVSALLATVCMAVNASTGKPNVAILATGGTIAAVGTDSGYTAGKTIHVDLKIILLARRRLPNHWLQSRVRYIVSIAFVINCSGVVSIVC